MRNYSGPDILAKLCGFYTLSPEDAVAEFRGPKQLNGSCVFALYVYVCIYVYTHLMYVVYI